MYKMANYIQIWTEYHMKFRKSQILFKQELTASDVAREIHFTTEIRADMYG